MFAGITITKVIGVTVLAWTKSKIFEVYYFRIWVALVVLAGSHALVLLPVLLSLAGGEGWASGEEDEGGLEGELGRRRRGEGGRLLYEGEEEEESDDEEYTR